MTTIDFTDVVKTLACPQCGSEDLATIEQITGIARAQITTNDIHYAGRTEIQWDTVTTIGVQCAEYECGWFYVGNDWQDQLAVVGEDEAPEVRPYKVTMTVTVTAANPEDAVVEVAEQVRIGALGLNVSDEHGYVGYYDASGPLPKKEA